MRPVLVFRWIVFLLAAGYSLRMIVFGGYDGLIVMMAEEY